MKITTSRLTARLRTVNHGFYLLLVLLLVSILSLGMLFPRRINPASAAVDVFSGERAMAHLPIIAREPHPLGSPAQAMVRDYLVQQLAEAGLEAEVQQTRGLENVVARLPGSDSTGAIVILAVFEALMLFVFFSAIDELFHSPVLQKRN